MAKRNPVSTRTIKSGPNKGDRVRGATARGGKGEWYPLRHVSDKSPKSTSKSATRFRK